MRQITRCPSCQTLFRIVPDQLRIADGWVRCGQCQQVFDANAHIPPTAPPAPPPPPPDAAPEEATPATTAPEPFLDINPGGLEHILPDGPTEPRLDAADLTATEATPHAAAPTVDLDFQPSFMPQPAPAHSKTRRWLQTAAWSLLSGLLALSLLLQVVVMERDWLAATQPTTKPWLQLLCNALDCAIAPVQHIEAVVIDSSAFTRVRGEVYRFSFTLKNTASIAIATPAVELTLTDLQDQALIRRVFLASELGQHTPAIDPNAELAVTQALAIKPAALAERVAGYRLLSFYP